MQKSNKFMALSTALKNNNVSLEKEEFKLILDEINGKNILTNQTLSPMAEMVLRAFEQKDLQDEEIYVIQTDKIAIAQNRSQLLKVLLNTNTIRPKIKIQKLGQEF